MFRLLFSLSLLLLPTIALSQTPVPIELRAPDGRTVILKSDGTWEYKKDTPPPSSSRPVSSDSETGALSPNYSGQDPNKLLVQLIDLRKRLVKSDFETTAEYAKRAVEEKKLPILNTQTIRDTFSLVASGVLAEYDADSQTMRLFLAVEKNGLAESYRQLGMTQDKMKVSDLSYVTLYKISLSGYRGSEVFFDDPRLPLSKQGHEMGFSTTIAVPVEEAKRLKSAMKAVLLVQFEEPYAVDTYSGKGQFQTRLVDIEFFDQQTGKILAKLGAAASPTVTPVPAGGTHSLLERAVELYELHRDDDALSELNRLVQIEPTMANAYVLRARIYLRNGDQEAAIAAGKTAVFWDPKLIEAHIVLARIYLVRGDRGEANKYVNNALNIDSTNDEAISLRRQIDR